MPDNQENQVKAAKNLGLIQGFCLGLGFMGLMHIASRPVLRPQNKGLEADWKAVGGDLRSAMRRNDDLR